MTIEQRDKYAYELMVKNNPEEAVKQLLLKDKTINDLKQRINVTIEYVENDFPYLEEPDEEIERCDGTTYMTMKEYDKGILLKKLEGEENDNFNKKNESN